MTSTTSPSSTASSPTVSTAAVCPNGTVYTDPASGGKLSTDVNFGAQSFNFQIQLILKCLSADILRMSWGVDGLKVEHQNSTNTFGSKPQIHFKCALSLLLTYFGKIRLMLSVGLVMPATTYQLPRMFPALRFACHFVQMRSIARPESGFRLPLKDLAISSLRWVRLLRTQQLGEESCRTRHLRPQRLL